MLDFGECRPRLRGAQDIISIALPGAFGGPLLQEEKVEPWDWPSLITILCWVHEQPG